MENEITQELQLTDEQSSLLDMHSFLNVMNVLTGELTVLNYKTPDRKGLDEAIELAFAISRNLSHTPEAMKHAEKVREYRKLILDRITDNFPPRQTPPDVNESITNINGVFTILEIRAREILARFNEPEKWTDHNIEELRYNFKNFFSAVEKNSKGRYRIVNNIAYQKEKDYLVNLIIESVDGGVIKMPPVFQDVMRDIIANARKYTSPGGKINAGLSDDGKMLRFVVEDNGKGIPEEQITQLVNFGERGNNVSDIRTMGGGFGLTKAYFVTKQFDGRMWIKSNPGNGTRIKIHIPRKY